MIPYYKHVDAHPIVNQVDFALQTFAVQAVLDMQEVKYHRVSVETYLEATVDRMIVQLRAALPTRKLSGEVTATVPGTSIQKTTCHTFHYSHPDGWWQAFKKRFFPKWLLSRYPVKYHCVTEESLIPVTITIPAKEVKVQVNADVIWPRCTYEIPDDRMGFSVMVLSDKGKVIK